MIIPRLKSGGSERQLCYLSHGLMELGHEVIVATLQDKENPPGIWNRNIQLERLGGWSNYDPRLIIQIYRLIREVRPDIIHTWNPQTDILGGIAAILNARSWIIRDPSCGEAYRSGWKAKLRARMGAKAAAVVSNSAGGAEYWRFLYPDKRQYVVSNGLPFPEINRAQPISRRELGIEKNQKFVLYAGRLRRLKRVDRIIAAIAKLDPELNPVVFICGEGEELNELQAQVRRLKVEDRVRFAGMVTPETIWAMMKSADLFVSLSDYEGMPNTVMEAMACGCPILVSDIPAHREIMDETTGCLVNPQDKKEIWNKLSSLLSSQALEANRNRALAAKEKAQSWTVKVMVKRYEKIYRDMITGRIYK